MHIDTDRRDQSPAHRAGGHPGRGLASAGALEDIAGVAESIFQDPREVRMTGADPGDPLRCESPRLDLHRSLPVLPVAVLDDQRDRRAESPATADPADDPGDVVLDLLAFTPPMSALTAA